MPTVAVIGASSDRRKFGNKAVRAFTRQGYTVIPINPHETTIEGWPVFRNVRDYEGVIDEASVYVPADVGLGVMEDLAAVNIPIVWLNPGADDDAVVTRARALGLSPRVACSILGIGERPYDL